METYFNRLLIFDGSHALHRALSQPELWVMRTSMGRRTGGVIGVIRTVMKELKQYNYFPVVVFDSGLSERRLKLYPNYKHNQDKQLLTESAEHLSEAEALEQEVKREYASQRNTLLELLPKFGIPVLYSKGWEGDDIIYALTKITENSIVVSDDKDLLQLIHQPDADDSRLCRVKRGMRDEFWDYSTLQENHLDINDYVCSKAIVGDPSDNIPSACFQVGEKTAPTLYKLYSVCIDNHIEFPTTEERLTEICKKFDIPKRKAFLNFNVNQFFINFLLTDLTEVDKELTDDIIYSLKESILKQASNYDAEGISEIFKELEIFTINHINLINNVEQLKYVLRPEDKEKITEIREVSVKQKSLF